MLPCTLMAAYFAKCSRATEEMFEHKRFNCKFASVLFDSVFTVASYTALIYSVFEIRNTPTEFPFGFKDDAKTEPLEVNQRIKNGAFYLLWIYIGFTSFAMVVSFGIFMKIESRDAWNLGRNKCTTFK